jgi:transposase
MAITMWISTNQMAEMLGVHEKTLRRMKSRGMFDEGIHYRKKNPFSSRGVFLWHIQRVELRLGLV